MINVSENDLAKLKAVKGDEFEWNKFIPSFGKELDTTHVNINNELVMVQSAKGSPIMLRCIKCGANYFLDSCNSCGSKRIRFEIDSKSVSHFIVCHNCGEKIITWSCSSCGSNNPYTQGSPYINTIHTLSKKGGGCFIATAVYGSPYAKEVIILKDFRDNYLLKYSLGKAFIKFYYWISPPFANQISKHNYMKGIAKSIIIIPLIKLVKKLKRKEINHVNN